jgi:excisionase family DNA binding protein
MSSPSRQSRGVARLLSIKEAAAYFRVSEKTVRRWIAAGVLVAHKLGRQWRIAPDEIERFLATRSSWKRRYVS